MEIPFISEYEILLGSDVSEVNQRYSDGTQPELLYLSCKNTDDH